MMNAMTQDTNAERRAWRNTLKRKICSRTDFGHNPQYVHTPYDLCHNMVEKLEQHSDLHVAQRICTLNLEFVEILCYTMGIEKSKIWFVTECLEKAAIALKHPRYQGINVVIEDYLTWKAPNNMKFDVIVGNPPYQTKSDAENRKTQAIWPEFVKQAFSLAVEGGYVCLIHPNGWRDVKGMFEDTKEIILSKEIQYLEMHDMNDGVKIFGVQSNYDWYVAKNTSPKGKKTHVRGQDGSEYDVDISKWNFIPSRMFDIILSLVAKEGEEKVEILRDATHCHTQKEWMSPEKKGEFKYPCIYSIKMGDKPTLWYSSTNKKGHFGIPKFIWGNGVCTSIGSIVDSDGEYGLTQFAYAIVDKKENLPLIKKAFDSPQFKELMKACPNQNNNINRKVIALFRKDFWKEFVG